jgi:hypothetical protein
MRARRSVVNDSRIDTWPRRNFRESRPRPPAWPYHQGLHWSRHFRVVSETDLAKFCMFDGGQYSFLDLLLL